MQHATGMPALTHLKRREPTAKKHTGNQYSKQKLSQHQQKQQPQLHSTNTTWQSTQRTHPRPQERGQLNLPTARTGERLNTQSPARLLPKSYSTTMVLLDLYTSPARL